MGNTIQEVEEIIEVRFTKNSHSWHDYDFENEYINQINYGTE